MDVFGDALFDYQQGLYTEDILTHSSLDEEDVMPLPYLFRDFNEMPKLEQEALGLCKGKILDIGCGAGSHSLTFNKKGLMLPRLIPQKEPLKHVSYAESKNCVHSDIMQYEGNQFDTLLLLMNGIGLAGELKNLSVFFSHLKKLMNSGAQILLDSSDIIYMFDDKENESKWPLPRENYYGEVRFTMKYKGKKSEEFSWLYLDKDHLIKAANKNGLHCEIVSFGEHFDYLTRLMLIK